MIRLLKNFIAVRPITQEPVSPQASPVNAANVAGDADKTGTGDGAAASSPSVVDGSAWASADPVAAIAATASPASESAPAPLPAPTPVPPRRNICCEVVGVGPGKRAESYSSWPQPLIPLDVSVGDKVIVGMVALSFSGARVTADDGLEAYLIQESDVIAVIDPDVETKETTKKPFAAPKGR